MPDTTTNPFAVLGVADSATPEAIRAAYVALVKRFPPDREPERFEAIRDAYAALQDARGRLRWRLSLRGVDQRFADLAPELAVTQPYLGPAPWLAAIREGTA